MSYSSRATWERQFPSGAWRVFDDRLTGLTPHHTRSFTYYGYTKREAQALHSRYIREHQKRAFRMTTDWTANA